MIAAPVIGSWYRRLDRPHPFQVVACDARAGNVDIEYFDGTVDEWPLAHWHGLTIEPCDAPQDASGPFDSFEQDEKEPATAPDSLADLPERVAEEIDEAPAPVDVRRR